MNKFYFTNERGHRQGHKLQKIQMKWVSLNQIRLKEPMEIQTIQPIKYLKWTTEFEYNGHEQLMLINYSHSSHIEILKYNCTYAYSYTHNIFSHLSTVETADVHHYWQWH